MYMFSELILNILYFVCCFVQKQERLRERLQQFSSVSGIEELLPPKVYELPNQTVTISTIGTDMMEKANLMLGSNLVTTLF